MVVKTIDFRGCTSLALHWHIICEESVYRQLLVMFLHMSTWLYIKMFQTCTDQNKSFICEKRDQKLENNWECLEDKLQLKFMTKINMHVCETHREKKLQSLKVAGVNIVFVHFNHQSNVYKTKDSESRATLPFRRLTTFLH